MILSLIGMMFRSNHLATGNPWTFIRTFKFIGADEIIWIKLVGQRNRRAYFKFVGRVMWQTNLTSTWADVALVEHVCSSTMSPFWWTFDDFCRGQLPRVPWAAGYGLKLQDTTSSLQRHTTGGPYIPYQEVTLHL
jgi:hypothetical protein